MKEENATPQPKRRRRKAKVVRNPVSRGDWAKTLPDPKNDDETFMEIKDPEARKVFEQESCLSLSSESESAVEVGHLPLKP